MCRFPVFQFHFRLNYLKILSVVWQKSNKSQRATTLIYSKFYFATDFFDSTLFPGSNTDMMRNILRKPHRQYLNEVIARNSRQRMLKVFRKTLTSVGRDIPETERFSEQVQDRRIRQLQNMSSTEKVLNVKQTWHDPSAWVALPYVESQTIVVENSFISDQPAKTNEFFQVE